MSRIDLALAPVDVLPLVHLVSYLPRGISDHAPLLVGLLLLPRSGLRVWRLKPHWLEDEIVQAECQRGVTDYWSMNQGTNGLTTAWDASKAVLRGTFMSITGILRKNAQQCTEELESALLKAEVEYSQNSHALSRWLHCCREYELCLLDLTKKRMLYVTQKIFEHGNKAGRLLAYLTRSDCSPVSVPRILVSGNTISDVPQDIAEAFLSFYQDLYTSRAHYSEIQLEDYLSQITLPRLTDQVREELD